MYGKSWSEAWSGNDIVYQSIGNSLYKTEGTLSSLSAVLRKQIGDHHFRYEISSDPNYIEISPKRFIKIDLEILDCIVDIL